MKSSYHIDPSKYSLNKFKSDLISRKLIPSRQPLKTGLDEKFSKFQALGWENLFDFKNALKNKKILIIKLSLGLIGEENSYLLGSLFLSKIKRTSTF